MSELRPEALAPDGAVERAREVVGFYGDPTVSWSIAFDATLHEPLAPADLQVNLERLANEALHLGRAPQLRVISPGGERETLQQFLDRPYGDHEPLIRVAVNATGDRLWLAAHHGAVDGLGLLSVLGHLLDEAAVSKAKGIARLSAKEGFINSSVRRLVEAVFKPPARLVATGGRDKGDVTAERHLPFTKVGTALVTYAAARTFEEWNATRETRTQPLVVALGVSRRDGSLLRPDRDTAYLRAKIPAHASLMDVSEQLARTDPEPDFPAQRRDHRQAAIRLLRKRLGSSLLVSNLGFVEHPRSVSRLAFYPVTGGPSALAVGVASTRTSTTLTVRMSGEAFDDLAADTICDRITQLATDVLALGAQNGSYSPS